MEDSEPHPPTADLVVEVADTSLLYDRTEKGAMYASAGIPTYWIVNLQEGVLEVYSQPESERYTESRIFNRTETVEFSGTGKVLEVGAILPG